MPSKPRPLARVLRQVGHSDRPRGAGHYAQLDARPELEAEALMALAQSNSATPDEISRLTALLESLGQFSELAQLYEGLSQADDASHTSRSMAGIVGLT